MVNITDMICKIQDILREEECDFNWSIMYDPDTTGCIVCLCEDPDIPEKVIGILNERTDNNGN